MKKILFVFMAMFLVGTAANAQACSKSAKKACTKKAATMTDADATKVASYVVEADALAEASDDIKRKECAVSGKVSYFQKETCEKSGKEKWAEVKYCEKGKKFTKVASVEMERLSADGKKTCSKSDKKACAKKCSKADKKACAKKCSKSDKKACAKKGATKVASAEMEAEPKKAKSCCKGKKKKCSKEKN